MTTETDHEYETHDIYLAAYLHLAGCQLVRQRRQGARKFFIFTNSAGPISELRNAFFSGTANVKPHAFSQLVIAYKQMCFDS